MHSLPPEKILAVWEAGRDQHELDRALTLLGAACPGVTRDELAALSIGERDARLLQLRARMFGSNAQGFVECPECAARVEVPIDTTAFEQPPAEGAAPREIESNGTRVRFRLPTSRDLAEVVASADESHALHRLVEQCVVSVSGAGTNGPRDLSPAFLDTLGGAMLAAEPQAEINLALECPECGHQWPLLFDPADFLWHELAAEARRLLHQIDVIARAYGWSEQEILRLSARRRQSYVELTTG